MWQRCTQGVNGALNLLTQPYRPDRGTASLVTLGSHRDLTREAVEAVAWGGERLALAPAALERVAPVDQDRPLGQDLAAIVAALERDELRLPDEARGDRSPGAPEARATLRR